MTGEGPLVDEVRRRFKDLIIFPYPDLLLSYGGVIYKYKGWRFLRMLVQLVIYVWNIRAKLKIMHLDGVYCNDMRGLLTVGLASRTLGLPVLIWDKLDKPHGWMDWFQLPLVNRNLIISKAVIRKYPKWQVTLMKKKITLIYDGADLNRFENAQSIRSTLGLGINDIVMAIIGTITHRKGQDRILYIWPEIIKRFSNLRLLMVGSTTGGEEDSKYFERLPNKNHPSVKFLGMREDIPNLMKSIDILLIPSRHEGLGVVIVEAMAVSIPVIGSNSGGIPEVIIDGKTGLVVEGDDPNSWITAISQLASSSELRKRMGITGRERAEHEFNRPIQMAKVLQHCVEMTNGRQKREQT